MKVVKRGDSLAVHLPTGVVETTPLREDEGMEFHVADGKAFGIEKCPPVRELLDRLRRFRGSLPKDFRFDRLERKNVAPHFPQITTKATENGPRLN